MGLRSLLGLDATQRSAKPANPPTGRRLLYPKSDGWYQLDSAGTEARLVDGTDSRLSDARTPTAHGHDAVDVASGVFASGRLANTSLIGAADPQWAYPALDGYWRRMPDPGWQFQWWQGARTSVPPQGNVASNHLDWFSVTTLYISQTGDKMNNHPVGPFINQVGSSSNRGLLTVFHEDGHWVALRIVGDAITTPDVGWSIPVQRIAGAGNSSSWPSGDVAITYDPADPPTPSGATVVADAAALNALTAADGALAYQSDTTAVYLRVAGAWKLWDFRVKPTARIGKAGAQTIGVYGTAGIVAVQMGTVLYELNAPAGFANTANDRLVAPYAGVYTVTWSVHWAQSTSGGRRIMIQQSGSDIQGQSANGLASVGTAMGGSFEWSASAGATWNMTAVNTATAGVAVNDNGPGTWLQAKWKEPLT